jgi:hypothetical protein
MLARPLSSLHTTCTRDEETMQLRMLPDARQEVVGDAVLPLVEPTHFYDPPYEAALDDEFAWHLVKYLNPVSGLRYLSAIRTPCGVFRVRFIAERGTLQVGFEWGGAEEDAESTRLRDALFVGSGMLDVLYRFKESALTQHLCDALYLASRWDPDLFSPRGRINLDTLSTAAARACRIQRDEPIARISYPVDEELPGISETIEVPELVVRRLSHRLPQVWIRDYERALAHFGFDAKYWARTA